MEGFRAAYKILFNIGFTLRNYPDDINQFFQIIPVRETQDRMLKYGVLTRRQKSSIITLVQVIPEGTTAGVPLITPGDSETLRFQVKCSDKSFFKRTHLSHYNLAAELPVLSNTVNHVSGTDLLLSKPLMNYTAADEYKKGFLVQNSGIFYRAVQASGPGNVHSVIDSSYWQTVPSGTYVSQADLMIRPPDTDLDAIMLIELSASGSVPSAYRLLDSQSKCREVSYKIRLLS